MDGRKDRDTPINRLRRGLCPICGQVEANVNGNGGEFISERSALPRCCCAICYSSDERAADDETWDVRICKDCPLRGCGPE